MLRAAIAFFILGIVSMVLGIYSIAGLSIEIGKMLLFVFLLFAIVSFVVGIFKDKKTSLLALAFLISMSGFTIADDTVIKTADEIGSDAKRATKKTVRIVQDRTCEMIRGKMECTVQKIKHAVQNAADEVEDTVD